MKSVYDIAYYFVTKINVNSDFDSIVKELNIVLDKGYTIGQIANTIKEASECLSILTLFRDLKDPLNLLKSDTFYYHNILRCIPPPPIQEWDLNLGIIKEIKSPYFLEMRASFTLEDLLKYYDSQMSKIKSDFDYDKMKQYNHNRFIGSLSFLVKKYGLELVLFMIDSATDYIISCDLKPLNSPIAISEYDKEALDRYNRKVSEIKYLRCNCIVVKERFKNTNGGGLCESN